MLRVHRARMMIATYPLDGRCVMQAERGHRIMLVRDRQEIRTHNFYRQHKDEYARLIEFGKPAHVANTRLITTK